MLSMRNATAFFGAALFAAGLSTSFTGTASATLVACTGSEVLTIEGVGYTTCMVDTDYGPSDAGEKASVEAVFGGTFTKIGKSEESGSGITADSGITGSFAMLVSLFDPTDEIAIIMKTGSGQNDPSDAVFGLWTAGALNAAFIAPGTEFNGAYDLSSWGSNGLSHMTVYVREGTDCCRDVPEPGPLGLLGGGMVVLYFVRRRRFLS